MLNVLPQVSGHKPRGLSLGVVFQVSSQATAYMVKMYKTFYQEVWSLPTHKFVDSKWWLFYLSYWVYRSPGSQISQINCCELAISEKAAHGHTYKVVSHANKESLSGNSSAIFEIMHTCITFCNRTNEAIRKKNDPNIALPAKRCRSARKMAMRLAHIMKIIIV